MRGWWEQPRRQVAVTPPCGWFWLRPFQEEGTPCQRSRAQVAVLNAILRAHSGHLTQSLGICCFPGHFVPVTLKTPCCAEQVKIGIICSHVKLVCLLRGLANLSACVPVLADRPPRRRCACQCGPLQLGGVQQDRCGCVAFSS